MEQNVDDQLGTSVRLELDFESAQARVVEALKAEGFGVLTEIDVRETFKKKLDVDYPAYKILGACNPKLSYRAISAAPSVGLLLPCNVTVRQLPDGAVEVSLVDPLVMMSVMSHPELKEVAQEAKERLNRVAQALRG